MHQQLGRGHPWILQVIVSTSAGAAVVISMMLVSCLWARWRRDSDPEPRAAYSSRGGRSVIFHSLGPTREAGAMASSEPASASAAPITEELRKYMAPTQREASASASVEAVATASFTAATGSAAIAAVAATAAAVSNDTDDRAPTENASCQERVSCSVLTQPDRGEGVPEGSGGSSGGGSALVSPDGDLSRGGSLAEQNSGAIIAAANSPRVAEAQASPSPPPSPTASLATSMWLSVFSYAMFSYVACEQAAQAKECEIQHSSFGSSDMNEVSQAAASYRVTMYATAWALQPPGALYLRHVTTCPTVSIGPPPFER
ncbi:hypothetical protein Vretifemale_6928 [Volvox reticuliferus]|uniref:Uncharacterized protein n=1 Tax=Volvox reticuliferus TaxID=1737510 RepID=A0A8J4FK46_9CHLO|nr:hypothetical protein Vretifemale_6928 [Volvox reticuliferus]